MNMPRRKTLSIALAALVVLAAAFAFLARTKLGIGTSASAPDTTLAADSTAAAAKSEAGADDRDDGKKKKKKKGEKKEDAPVPVEVTTVSPRSISTFYQTTATLEPEKRVDILAKIGGEVVEMLVEEGDFVREGEGLCRLNDAELRVALEEARINRDKQKAELERVESMHKQDLISIKEYQDFQYQYELAENRYESARVKFEYAHIKAPFSGVVTSRLVDPGENIAIGTKLFVMADTEPLLLSMYLPEAEARRVRRGQAVFIHPDSDPGTEFAGEILRIAPEVDQRTGTVKVTAQTRGGGVPGSFVRVKILTDTHHDVLAIPRRSLVSDAGDRYVFIAAADTVRKVEVQVGYEDEDHAEVTAGLTNGDSVVTAGVGGIREGTKVRVVRPEDKTAARAAPRAEEKN